MKSYNNIAVLIGDNGRRYRVMQVEQRGRVVAASIRQYDEGGAEWNRIEYIEEDPFSDVEGSHIDPTDALRAAIHRLDRIYGVDVDRIILQPDYGTVLRTQEELVSYLGVHGGTTFDFEEVNLAANVERSNRSA